MALEKEILELQQEIAVLDKQIDQCDSGLELNLIGSKIKALELRLEPLLEAIAQCAQLEAATANLKDKASRLGRRL